MYGRSRCLQGFVSTSMMLDNILLSLKVVNAADCLFIPMCLSWLKHKLTASVTICR